MVHTLEGEFVRSVDITSHKEASGSIHMLVEGENTPKISFIPDPLPKTKPVGLEVDSDGFLYVMVFYMSPVPTAMRYGS